MWNLLAENRHVRKAADALFLTYANRRTRSLDHTSAIKAQRSTLRRLLSSARNTKFGMDHGFSSIRTIDDYQTRVPVRDYAAFWNDYFRNPFPNLDNLTWPGKIPHFALSSGTTMGATKYIPVTNEMLRSNRQAALTSLAWFRAAHPQRKLFTGSMFFLGGSTDLVRLGNSSTSPLGGDLSGIVSTESPALLRSFVFPPPDLATESNWNRKLERMARQSISLPITLISGVPSWLLVLFERMRQLTGKETIAEIWPTLQVVVHGGTRFDPYRSMFRRMVGERVAFLETYPSSEGFIAAEDPRHQMLRLIPDHGVFFEFIPFSELHNSHPTRHTLETLEVGENYAIALTTCAGLWSYLIGDTVCFESRDPPLLRFTGRTRQFLSAFGEHLIGEEIEKAIAKAAIVAGVDVIDFHVGPVFPTEPGAPGRHRYFVEFAFAPSDFLPFAQTLDRELCLANEDYRAHRAGDLTMLAPELIAVPKGGFATWMQSRGKLGGQNKVPRIDNSGAIAKELTSRFQHKHQEPQLFARSGTNS